MDYKYVKVEKTTHCESRLDETQTAVVNCRRHLLKSNYDKKNRR